MRMIAALVAAALLVGPPVLRAQAEKETSGSDWTYGAELDLNSRYLWRSLIWNDKPVAQPSVWIGRSGLTFSVWSNFVLGDEPNRRQFNEIDCRISYGTDLGPVTIKPAVTVYSYPHQPAEDSPTTGELEIQLSCPVGPFVLETTHFLDFIAYSGGYVGEIGCEYEGEPGGGLSFDAAGRLTFGNATFMNAYIPYGKGGVHAFILELGLTVPVSGSVTLRPHLEWDRILDPGVRAAVEASPWLAAGRGSVILFGLAVGFEK
jgi:hypothetical protein